MTYFLILFAKSEKQETFVQVVAENLGHVSDNKDVRYYFGAESCIFKFVSKQSLTELSKFIKDLFKNSEVAYFLSEYSTDNMSFQIPDSIEKFLFDDEVEMTEFTSFMDNSKQLEDVNIELDSSIHNLVKELYEMDNRIVLEKKPSLDQILEKINKYGMHSLTEKELNLLNEYSKQL